jgi:hypothetical protein
MAIFKCRKLLFSVCRPCVRVYLDEKDKIIIKITEGQHFSYKNIIYTYDDDLGRRMS